MLTHDGYREWSQEELDADPYLPQCDYEGCTHQAGYACIDCGGFFCRAHAAPGSARWDRCAECHVREHFGDASADVPRDAPETEGAAMWSNERGLIEGLMRLARASVADDSAFRLAWRACAFGGNDQPLIVSEAEQALDWLEQVLERHGDLREIVRVVATTDEGQMTLAEYWALRTRAQALLADVQEPTRVADGPPPGRPNPLRKSGFSQHTEKPLPRPSELDDLR